MLSFLIGTETNCRREICKTRSSLNASICRSSLHFRQDAFYFTNSLVEGENNSGRRTGNKQSWLEQAEVYRKYKTGGQIVKCKDGVGGITYCQTTEKEVAQKLYEFSDGRNFNSKEKLPIPLNETVPWKETIPQAQSITNTESSYFDKVSERPTQDSNHEGQDNVHCDRANVSGEAKLSQKPKSKKRMHSNTEKSANPRHKLNVDHLLAPNGMHDVITRDFDPDLDKINGHNTNSSNQSKLSPKEGSKEAVQPKGTPNIRGQLTKLYNKVLVVNTVPVAKKVVQMLTNSYRHLVHACDTEV